MEKKVSAHEAFADIMENIEPVAFPRGKRTGTAYNAFRQAVYAFRGTSNRDLTAKWVAEIIGRYGHLAPGRYRVDWKEPEICISG